MVETESIPPTLQVFRYKESNQLNAQQEELLRLKEKKRHSSLPQLSSRSNPASR